MVVYLLNINLALEKLGMEKLRRLGFMIQPSNHMSLRA